MVFLVISSKIIKKHINVNGVLGFLMFWGNWPGRLAWPYRPPMAPKHQKSRKSIYIYVFIIFEEKSRKSIYMYMFFNHFRRKKQEKHLHLYVFWSYSKKKARKTFTFICVLIIVIPKNHKTLLNVMVSELLGCQIWYLP